MPQPPHDLGLELDLDIQKSRSCVAVGRQLQAELKLIEQLESLNTAIAQSLTQSGVHGLRLQQSESLNQLAQQLSCDAAQVRACRAKVLEMINDGRTGKSSRLTIRQFIAQLDGQNQSRLEAIRQDILDRLTNIHANMLGNQAVMFYSYSFNKKMVSGLLGSNLDESQYSEDGQSTGVRPGNIYRKAC